MIPVQDMIDVFDTATKQETQEALRFAKNKAHDFTIPQAERHTWRDFVPFIAKQLKRY